MSAPTRVMDARIRERRRTVAQERARRRRRRVASVVTAVLVAGGAYALTYTPLFAVTEVTVEGVTGDRAEAVRSVAGVVPGQRLLDVDLDGVAAAVEDLAWVRATEVTRQPPSTVVLAVAVRTPVAVLRTADQAWLVDADGVLVAGGDAADLLEIYAPDTVLPGAGAVVRDPTVRTALDVHARLAGPLRAGVVRYEAHGQHGVRMLLDGRLIADDADDLWVRVGSAERVDAKARVIGLLIEQLRAGSGRVGEQAVAELDVRVPDNPVLVPASE